MERRTLLVAVVAALVLLAGCIGGPGVDSTDPDGTAPGGTATTPTGGELSHYTGTVHFYVSDEPNAIEDFEHLNVTITAVGLHRVEDGASTPESTATPGDGTATPGDGTATPDEEEGEDGMEGGDEEDERNSEWVEYEVNRTVDLTELVGANATTLDVLEAPAGTYDKVFVYVEEIDATLENGESVNVKLPSEKLHINKQFEVGNGQAVDFVFDIAIHKAGKSGKYILKPVVSQSGTGDEVDIEDVDEREGGADDGRDNGDDRDEGDDRKDDRESDAGSLLAEFVGPVEHGDREAELEREFEDGAPRLARPPTR